MRRVAREPSCSCRATKLFRGLKRPLPLPWANKTTPSGASGIPKIPSSRTRPERIVTFSEGCARMDADIANLFVNPGSCLTASLPFQGSGRRSARTSCRIFTADLTHRCETSVLGSERRQFIRSRSGASPSFQHPVDPIAIRRSVQKDVRPIGFAAVATTPRTEPEGTLRMSHINVRIDRHESMTSLASHVLPFSSFTRAVIDDVLSMTFRRAKNDIQCDRETEQNRS